MHLETRFKS